MEPKQIAKYVGIGLLVLIVLVGLLFAAGILGVPDGGLEDNQWGEVDNESIEVITYVWVDNPNPFGMGGDADVDYAINLSNVRLAEGGGEGIGISPGNQSLEFRTDLYYNRLPEWWSKHLNNDEVSPLEADATVHASLGPFSGSPSTTVEDEIGTDIEGALDEGFSEFEGEYPEGAPSLVVQDVTTEWGEVTESKTEIIVTTTIHNPELPNPAPVPTPAFEGELTFNDIHMANWTAGEVEVRNAADDALIGPGETEERIYVVTMDNQGIPPWFASHVENDEYTEIVLSARLVVDMEGQELTIPPTGAITCTFDMTTSIFVDQESSMDLQLCGVEPGIFD